MASIGDTTRPEYIYDQATDTWIPVGIGPHSHTAASIGAIAISIVTAKGDLIAGTGNGTISNLPVGTDGQFLSASSGASTGLAWSSSVTAGTTSTATTGVGYMGLPQNATTTGSYTIAAADAGKHIYSTATRTITIDSNANLALPVGTTITFISGLGATTTIAITSDTMYLAGTGTTGSRTLAAYGMATAVKIASTTWIISGNGLT